MQITKTQKIITVIIILIVLVGAYLVFDRKSGNKEKLDIKNVPVTGTENVQVGVQGTGDYKIEQIPISEGKSIPQPIPDLSHQTIFASFISPETKTMISEKIIGLQTELKKNPAYFDAWLDLSTYQKLAGDYNASLLSMQYANKLAPNSYIPLGGLGGLYANFLNDKVKAESYYKQAISKDSMQSYLYVGLAEVYINLFKDKVKAKSVVEDGLSKIPSDQNLLELQSSLK